MVGAGGQERGEDRLVSRGKWKRKQTLPSALCAKSHIERKRNRATWANQLACLYRQGLTLQQIGDMQTPPISRERVRQLLAEFKIVSKTDGGNSKRAKIRRELERQKKEERCLKKRGCTLDQYKAVQRVGKKLLSDGVSWQRTPIGAFDRQRQSAKNRGIEWRLLFWEWWSIWKKSGFWNERGRGNGFVMARFGDRGPYSVDNVKIVPAYVNSSLTKNKKSGLPVGVRYTKNGRDFIAEHRIGGKTIYLGTFKTPEAGHAAYMEAKHNIRKDYLLGTFAT